MQVVINGKTYEVVNGIYHLVATYGLACEIGDTDIGSMNPNELLPKGYIADTGCKIKNNPFFDYTNSTKCVLYEDLERDFTMLDGDENTSDFSTLTYTTTDDKIIYPYPFDDSSVTKTIDSATGEVIKYSFNTGVSSWYKENELSGDTDDHGNIQYYGIIEINSKTIPTRTTTGNPGVFDACKNTLKTVKTHINPIIGINCFRDCINLTEVTILGNTDNDSVDINEGAFSGCTSLSTFIIGCYWKRSLNNKVSIGDYCFVGDTQLKRLQGQDNIASIGKQTFKNCTSLDTLTLINCLSIGQEAFSGCTNLERVILNGDAGFDNNIFSGCTKIEEIIFLGDCSSSSTITTLMEQINSVASNNLVVRVENNYLSAYQTKFSSISTSKSWKSALSANTYNSRGDIILGEYNDGSGVWDTSVAFNWLKYNTRTLTIFDARKVLNVDIRHGDIIYENYDAKPNVDNAYDKNSTLVQFNGFKGFTSVTSIGNEAFSGCTGLTTITIPDSVTSIGESAFNDCSGLTSVTIGSGVTDISNNVFSACTSLTTITIPDNVDAIGENVFEDCESLSAVTLGSGITSIGSRAFKDCSGLTSITIPDSMDSISTSTFSGCTSLSSVTLGSGITEINDSAFYECSGLTNIIIPDIVDTIGNSVFSGCTSLTSITIPDSVHSIGNNTFEDCTGLTSVIIGSSDCNLESLGDNLFSGCRSLTAITYAGEVEDWGRISRGTDWHYNVPATVVQCSNGTVSLDYVTPSS